MYSGSAANGQSASAVIIGYNAAGAVLQLNKNLSLEAKFDGQFANTSQIYAGTGTVRYAW